jgi:tetratricopeptide (TPR) repeat protein
MMKCLSLFFFLSLFAWTNGSAQAKWDSLWQVWNNPAELDSNRLKAIQALTWPMLSVNLDSANILANMQLDYAEKRNDRKWIGKALYNIATYYYYVGDYPHSLEYYDKSLSIRKELGDLKGEAAIYGNIGLIYSAQGNYLKDLEYQLKSLAINEKLRDTANLTSNYNNIAIIYHEQEDTANAMAYYNRTIRMYEAKGDERGLGVAYNNIGTMYKTFKEWDRSLYYLHKSLEIRTRLKDRLGSAITYVNLGTVYNKMKQFDKAREYTLLSIEEFKTLGDSSSLTNGYYTLGEIALNQKQYKEAIRWCTASLDIAVAAQKAPVERAACYCLYTSWKALGNSEKALYYFEDFYFLEDSLGKADLEIALKQLEYEKELLADSLSMEEERNNLTAAYQKELARKNNVTRLVLIVGIGVLLLALLFLSRMVRYQRNSQLFKLKSEQLEKQQLVSEISLLKTQVNPHFLFNSLSILSSLVRVNPDLSEKFIDQLARSYRYILEQKDQPMVTLRTELGFIESYCFLLKIRFEHKFEVNIDLPESILDKYKIAPLTLQLLIENAVKHSRMSVSEPLTVTIVVEKEQMLVVRNKLQPRSTPSMSTGVGLQNIMDRYALLTTQPVWAGEADDQFVVKIPLLNG